MALNIHTSHRTILFLPAVIYVVLVLVVAVWPAWVQTENESQVPEPYPDELVERGREVYRSYNCVTCHTQQIRGDRRRRIEVDGREIVPVLAADARFGRDVPTRAEEYAHQAPPLLGTQRTGPDLSAVGSRLPESQWHYWHLYDARSVSPGSNMPPHPFLFTTERPSEQDEVDYDQVQLIQGLGFEGKELWATPDAKALVEYLLSLRREGIGEDAGGR